MSSNQKTTSRKTRSARQSRSSTRKTSPSGTDTSKQQDEPSPERLTDPSSTLGFTELEPLPFKPPATRDPNTGQFLPGKSGNPAGRPPNRKNQITEIKQELELAVRQNISPAQIAQIVHRMYELALMGSVGAAKLILDKTISNARTEEEDVKDSGGVRIVIDNLTLEAPNKGEKVIDITPTQPEESE